MGDGSRATTISLSAEVNFVLQRTVRTMLGVVLATQLWVLQAASPAIGVAMANGSLRLNDARVQGNGTIFEGTRVVTSEASSRLRLDGGVEVELASDSRGTVYSDHLVLERGTGQLVNAGQYRIEAMGLAISSDEPGSSARVQLKDDVVEVAALLGGFRVSNRDGILLATLAPGRALSLTPAADGASAPSSVAGCVQEVDGLFLLTDETAGLTVELRGMELNDEVGHQVTLTGVIVPSTEAAEGASQVMQVSNIRTDSTRCSSSAASAAKAGAAAGTSTAMKTVIAGVVVAAAGTGAAIGLTRGSEEPETISR